MLLKEAEIQRSRARVVAAFPRFTEWEYANAPDVDQEGFAIWGQYAHEAESPAAIYFVTFDTHKAAWRGHLTVGKHFYYWSDTEVGDAYLLDTEACATLDEAIASLKERIGTLSAALSGSKT